MDGVIDYENASRLYVKVCERLFSMDESIFKLTSNKIAIYEALLRVHHVCSESASSCKTYIALLKEKTAIAQQLVTDKSMLSADSVVLL